MPTEEDFRVCQGGQHKFERVEIPFHTATRALWRYRESWLCERCTTVRHDVINVYGDVVSRRYVYPKGYRWPRNEGDRAPTKSEKRLAMIRGSRHLRSA